MTHPVTTPKLDCSHCRNWQRIGDPQLIKWLDLSPDWGRCTSEIMNNLATGYTDQGMSEIERSKIRIQRFHSDSLVLYTRDSYCCGKIDPVT